jgi:hypothetical protein
MTTTIRGGDIQATPWQGDARSYYVPQQKFCEETGLIHIITPTSIHTCIPAQTHIDHWLLRQPTTTPYYNTSNTHTSTHTPELGDHKSLILELPTIGNIEFSDAKRIDTTPTTTSHPPFILHIPQDIVEIFQLGNATTATNTRHTKRTLDALREEPTMDKSKIDYATAQVVTIIHDFHDIATTIWPMQPPRQDITMPHTSIRQSQEWDSEILADSKNSETNATR